VNLVQTLKVVQNPNRAHLSVVPDDRRQRAREKKRVAILRAADALIAEDGLRGVTMQRVADRLDCAVGTLYLYFPSKAALVAGLQGEAIDTLRASYETAAVGWEAYLEESDLEDDLQALVRLDAFGALTSASVVFADEFHLQRALLSEKVTVDAADEVRDVLPVLQRLLDHPRGLVLAASDRGVLAPDDASARAARWIAALNGVLLLEAIAPVDRHLFRAQHLARALTHDLLVGWGAAREDVDVAAAHVERLAALGPLAPPPEGPGYD
jgi:AcrR family transcriptional regulator